MGIKSSVRAQYWQDGREATQYFMNNTIVSRAEVEPDIGDAILAGLEVAYRAASVGISLAEGNFLSAGIDAYQLNESLNSLKNTLADKTASTSATLRVPYPHPNFNTIRLIFEAESTFDDLGDRDSLGRVGHSPPGNLHSPIIRFQEIVVNVNEDNRTIHCKAEYIINLDELYKKISETSGDSAFFSDELNRKPFTFVFATKETYTTFTTASVLHNITLNFNKKVEKPPTVTTDIVYWNNPTSGNDVGSIVERQRLMQHTVGETSPERLVVSIPDGALLPLASGENILLVDVTLTQGRDGKFIVNGKPYDYLSLEFRADSLRKYNPERPPIVISGDAHPDDAKGLLKPVVHRPIRSRVQTNSGDEYEPEGIGTASLNISPNDIPLATHQIIFSASQQPGGWVATQTVRLKRGLIMQPLNPVGPVINNDG